MKGPTFDIGDRVTVNNYGPKNYIGKSGVVRSVSDQGRYAYSYGVTFDDAAAGSLMLTSPELDEASA